MCGRWASWRVTSSQASRGLASSALCTVPRLLLVRYLRDSLIAFFAPLLVQAPTHSWTACLQRCPTWSARCAGEPSRPSGSATCCPQHPQPQAQPQPHPLIPSVLPTPLPPSLAAMCRSICFEELDLAQPQFQALSEEARTFIQGLLVKDPLQARTLVSPPRPASTHKGTPASAWLAPCGLPQPPGSPHLTFTPPPTLSCLPCSGPAPKRPCDTPSSRARRRTVPPASRWIRPWCSAYRHAAGAATGRAAAGRRRLA